MPVLAFVFFVLALVLFVVDAVVKTPPARLIPWGLAALTIGIALIFLIEDNDPLTF
jgi:hypothetical protein